MDKKPLVVDLDGTLIRSDLLLESLCAYLAQSPLHFLHICLWLLRGRAWLKSKLAEHITLDVALLPYNEPLLERLRQEKAAGRIIILATASHTILARRVAEHLGLFAEVMASDASHNLKGIAKRDALLARFGDKGFDYIGDSHADLPILAAANEAFLVSPSPVLQAHGKTLPHLSILLPPLATPMPVWAKALRFHQWLKNLLLFVPLFAGHQLKLVNMVNGITAFILFGMCASSVYLLNDILDLQDDRHHPYKRQRVLASGTMTIQKAFIAFLVLLSLSFVGAGVLLPFKFVITLACYYLLTLAYSLGLKKMMALDVIVLTLLYTLRIIAGAAIFGGELTFWLIAFSTFIFLSLALVKRYTELYEARKEGSQIKARGRGYYPEDLEMIASLGASSGYISVMVLALYIQDPSTIALYHYPKLIWLACPILLFWISRTWILSHRGQMHMDPVIFAIKDRVSLFTGLLFGIIFWLAT